MARGRLWTPEEDALLHEAAAANRREGARNTATGSRMRALAERLGRSRRAVQKRASRGSPGRVRHGERLAGAGSAGR